MWAGDTVHDAPNANWHDYMMDEDSFLAVQDGKDAMQKQAFTSGRRLIATPRDLATYVHFDALYQAYLNACLILLAQGAPFDQIHGDAIDAGERI